MKKFVFAALAVSAMIWGAAAGALRQSPQEHLTMNEIAADWSIAEAGTTPDWLVTPAHVRMW